MTAAPPTIREARPDDAAGIAEVLVASRRTFLPYLPEVHPPAAIARWVAGALLPAGGVQVAVDGADRVVAVLATSQADGVGWIDQLYVRPGHEGRGLGTRLLARAHDRLPMPIRLYTFTANAPARRFYERHGYRAIAFGDGDGNEEGHPDVLYERTEPPRVDDTPSPLHVEPLRPDHLDELATVLRHPAVYAHIGGEVPSPDDFRRGLEIALAGPPAHRHDEAWVNLLVRAHPDGPMLGRLEATVHDGLAEVAFLFGPDHWGRGHAARGLAMLHRWLARRHAVSGFWATTVPANHRCQALVTRLGYVPAQGPLPPLLSFDDGDLVFRRPVQPDDRGDADATDTTTPPGG